MLRKSVFVWGERDVGKSAGNAKDVKCNGHPCTLEEHKWGHYPSGEPISEHPSPEEIQENYAYWYTKCSEQEQETLQGLHDVYVFEAFKKYVKPRNAEDAITKAIEWWMKYYPHEVKEFQFYIQYQKDRLANSKGFSNDREKMHMWQGSIPNTVKQLLLRIDPDFFRARPDGKVPGYTKFYKIYTQASIGGGH